MIMADAPEVEQDLLSIEERGRMGLTLLSIYKGTQPLGSLLLDPIEDKYIIDEIYAAIKRCESSRKQEAARARARQVASKSRGNEKGLSDY